MMAPGNERLREVWGTTQDNLETAVGTAYSSWTRFNRAYLEPCVGSVTTCATRCGAGVQVCFGRKPSRHGRGRRGHRGAGRGGVGGGLLRGNSGGGIIGGSGSGGIGAGGDGDGEGSYFNSGRRDSFNIFYDTYDEDVMFGRDELERLLNSQDEYSDEYYYDDDDSEYHDDDGYNSDDDNENGEEYDEEEEGDTVTTEAVSEEDKNAASTSTPENAEVTTVPAAPPLDKMKGKSKPRSESSLDPLSRPSRRKVIRQQPTREGEMAILPKRRTRSDTEDPSSSNRQQNSGRRHGSGNGKRRTSHRLPHHDMAVEPPVQDQMIGMQPPHQRLLHESQSRISEFWKTLFPNSGNISLGNTSSDRRESGITSSFWLWNNSRNKNSSADADNNISGYDATEDFNYRIVLNPQDAPQAQGSIWNKWFGQTSTPNQSAAATGHAQGGKSRKSSRGHASRRGARSSFSHQQHQQDRRRSSSSARASGGPPPSGASSTTSRARSSTKSSVQSSETYRSRRELLSDVESADAQMVSDNFASSLVYGAGGADASSGAESAKSFSLSNEPSQDGEEDSIISHPAAPGSAEGSNAGTLKILPDDVLSNYNDEHSNDDADDEEFGELVSSATVTEDPRK